MKKILLLAAFATTLLANAQDLSVTLSSPTSGSTITAGQTFSFDGTISNNGSAAHTGFAGGDTVIYLPTINGSAIGNGQGGIVGWYYTDPISAGGSGTFSQSLTLSGGQTGNWNFCALIIASGNSYASVEEDSACAAVSYNSIGFGELRLQETFDNSFYNNGTYFVQVSSKNNLINPSIEIVDVNGRVVMAQDLNANGGEIKQELNIDNLPRGMYIVRLRTVEGLISINKIMK